MRCVPCDRAANLATQPGKAGKLHWAAHLLEARGVTADCLGLIIICRAAAHTTGKRAPK
jgi:hypothetical protein